MVMQEQATRKLPHILAQVVVALDQAVQLVVQETKVGEGSINVTSMLPPEKIFKYFAVVAPPKPPPTTITFAFSKSFDEL
jgi:hypothetical protein